MRKTIHSAATCAALAAFLLGVSITATSEQAAFQEATASFVCIPAELLASVAALNIVTPPGARTRGFNVFNGPSEKGGRVRATAVQKATVPPVSTRLQSLLGTGLASADEQMRTALTGPQSTEGRASDAMRSRSTLIDLLPLESENGRAATLATTGSDELVADPVGTKNELLTLAYAPAERAQTSRFDHVLGERTGGFAPPIGPEDHSWAARLLPPSAFDADEQKCLANGIYFEARGETTEGQAAVAQVILNRVRNPAFPDTICDVVYQNRTWKNRCQFSFACDGIEDRITDRASFATAETIAHQVTDGEVWLPSVGSATNYHANYVSPRWASAMKRVDKIGSHIFYRTFGGGWD